MEGSGNGFFYYAHSLSPFGHPQGGGADVDMPFSSPSPVAPAAGEAAAMFPHLAAEPVRRKRGRPRKYGPPLPSSANPAVSASLSFSPLSFSAKPSSSTSLTLDSSSRIPQNAFRRMPQDESLVYAGKSAQKFTPHFLTVAAGEDVAKTILSFVQEQNRAVCVISASGTIGDVTLRQPASASGHMTYKGNFDILSLSGSFILSKDGASVRSGALSVCLSEEGFIVGGGIGGPLVAATTVLVVAGSFLFDSNEECDAKLNSSFSATFPVVSEESLSMGFHLDDDHHHLNVGWGGRKEGREWE